MPKSMLPQLEALPYAVPYVKAITPFGEIEVLFSKEIVEVSRETLIEILEGEFITVDVFNADQNLTVTGAAFVSTSTNSTAETNETDVVEEDEDMKELLRALGKTSRRRLRKSLKATEKEEKAPLQDT